LDANGIVLAESTVTDQSSVRQYPLSPIGPAVGYYSFRHGTAGVEAGYNTVLRGDDNQTWQAFWRRTLHQAQVGRDIRLTLDADWQTRAEALMANHTGALVVLSVPDGAVKVMVSAPGYDPNLLDERFDQLVGDEGAPLLNRATQGLYQPGRVLQPFVLAYAVEQGAITLRDNVSDAGEPVPVNGQVLACDEAPGNEATWQTILPLACPQPFVQLADLLGVEGLMEAFDRVGFFAQPQLPLATAQDGAREIGDVDAAILGQDLLTLSPMQIARATAALASGGQLPDLFLVREAQDHHGVWQRIAPDAPAVQAIEAGTADAVLDALPDYEGDIAELATVALSGPRQATTSWYLGVTPVNGPQYVAVVVIEEATDTAEAQEIGRSILRAEPVSN
jgi:peptidoglycan glycosyltransferase